MLATQYQKPHRVSKRYSVYKKDKELAAKSLGISRATLYRKIEKYGIK